MDPCRHCGAPCGYENVALTHDTHEPYPRNVEPICRTCLGRVALAVQHPEALPPFIVASLERQHGDVVVRGFALDDRGDMVPAWRWTTAWPVDDRLIHGGRA